MSYWGFKSVSEQLRELKNQYPNKSITELKALVLGTGNMHRTNPARPRFSGAKEIARRAAKFVKQA